MKEIQSLIDRSARYLRSSELLLRDGDYESSVSRTYYAMFYAVQATLLSQNMSASSHKGTISQFGEHFIKTNIFPKEIGRELNRAFAKRQVGDYTHSFVVSALEAEQLLESGRTFVAQITQYLKDQKLL